MANISIRRPNSQHFPILWSMAKCRVPVLHQLLVTNIRRSQLIGQICLFVLSNIEAFKKEPNVVRFSWTPTPTIGKRQSIYGYDAFSISYCDKTNVSSVKCILTAILALLDTTRYVLSIFVHFLKIAISLWFPFLFAQENWLLKPLWQNFQCN